MKINDKISDYYEINIAIDKNLKYFEISDEVLDYIIQIYELIMDTFKKPSLINSHLYFSRYDQGFDFIVYSYDIIKVEINDYYWKPYEIGKLDNYKEWNKINMNFYYLISGEIH